MEKTFDKSYKKDGQCLIDRQTDKQRLEYIDACKGFGIILVILGHVEGIPNYINLVIYSFHMPLFFILSGYVFGNAQMCSFRVFLYKKVKKLLVPYFTFACVNLFLDSLWNAFYLHKPLTIDYFIKNIRGIFFCYSNLENMPNCSPIWFLMALFFSSIILYWLLRINWKYNAIILLLFIVVSWGLSPLYEDMTLFPWKFPVFLMGTFFMYIGYLFRKVINYCNNKNNHFVFLSILAIFVSIVIELLSNNIVSMNNNKYGNLFVFVLVAVIISISIVYLFRCISFLSNKLLIWFGKNTLYIIGLNYFFCRLALELYYFIPFVNKNSINFIILFLLTLIPIIGIIIICNRIKGMLICKLKNT